MDPYLRGFPRPGVGSKHNSKNFPTGPCGAWAPKPPGPTVYVSEFLNRLGVISGMSGVCDFRGMLGFP